MRIWRIKVFGLAVAVFCQLVKAQSADPAVPEFLAKSVVVPQMFGAVGDGANHPVSAADVAAKQSTWVGKYAAGDEWDYVGLQEAIYASFNNGTLTPNGRNARLNKTLYLPPGNYLVNKPPTVALVFGGSVTGAGRFATTITSTFAGPAFQTNGCWYTQFTGITFAATVPQSGAVFELDGNYDGASKQGVQGNTFKDCYFEAAGKAAVGLAIVRLGGNTAQGSENLFLNCHFQSGTFSGVYISGFNALQNTFVGGNIQDCRNGIYVHAGSINVDSMGFQNGFQKQIDGDGFDVVLNNSADDHSSVRNCRSESARLIHVRNKHYVVLDNNNLVNTPPSGEWAPGKTYPRGAIISGKTSGKGDGRLFIAMTEGTSGATEPDWPGLGTLAANLIRAGSDELGLDGAGLDPAAAENYGVVVTGAGPEGKPLYATIRKSDKGKWAMTEKATTAVSMAQVRLGPLAADGGIKWMHYEYDEVVTDSTVSVTNNSFRWGRTRFGGGAIAHNNFARADNLELLAKLRDGPARASVENNRLTRNGGWNSGADEKPSLPDKATSPDPTPPRKEAP
ncbi:MAG TPA: right-handed parallel beta-helix repeat-containing protein [Chthoniobacterales bacterium]|jgi:hypothetical protein|nr:right-handed parallel beta-helix repeat-containing protein [Chthoniobacterales bacterium]